MKKILPLLLLATLSASCSGLRETDSTFTAHAESFRIFGFAIPGEDNEAAVAKVPEGATIETIRSSPADWTSVAGALNNILGFSYTEISGTK
jgi:hypothetical protein